MARARSKWTGSPIFFEKVDHVLLTPLESLRYFGVHTTVIETGPSFPLQTANPVGMWHPESLAGTSRGTHTRAH